jgi:hypothetical protein
MGTDYYSNSGYELSLERFASKYVYNVKTKAQQKRLIKAVNDCLDESYDRDIWPDMEINTYEDVIALWEMVTAYEGECGKYEGNMKLTYWSEKEGYDTKESDDLCELVDYIGSAEGMPTPELVRIFDSYRQHEEMTKGEPQIIYGENDLYEKTLTDRGKKLQKLIGGRHMYKQSWTDVSY